MTLCAAPCVFRMKTEFIIGLSSGDFSYPRRTPFLFQPRRIKTAPTWHTYQSAGYCGIAPFPEKHPLHVKLVLKALSEKIPKERMKWKSRLLKAWRGNRLDNTTANSKFRSDRRTPTACPNWQHCLRRDWAHSSRNCTNGWFGRSVVPMRARIWKLKTFPSHLIKKVLKYKLRRVMAVIEMSNNSGVIMGKFLDLRFFRITTAAILIEFGGFCWLTKMK